MEIKKQLSILLLALAFTSSLHFRLFIAIFFRAGRWFISTLVRNVWRRDLRTILSTNQFLAQDGSLPVAHNLLVSFQIQRHLDIAQFTQMFLEKCIFSTANSAGAGAADTGTTCGRRRHGNWDGGGRRVGDFPELQEKIVICCGYPFWKQDERFEISRHIVDGNYLKSGNAHALDQDADADDVKDVWFEIEQNVLNRQFELDEGSPWRIYVLHSCHDNDDGAHAMTKLIFVFHHSLGDGRSMYNLLMRVADDGGDHTAPSHECPGETKQKKQVTSPSSSVLSILWLQWIPLLLPLKLIRDFLKCQPLPPFYVPASKCGDGDGDGRGIRHFVKSSKIPLQNLKQIAKIHNVPFTSVLLCGMTGALRKYLQRRSLNIPDFVFCPMPVPLATHARGLTNAVQSVNFVLPLGANDLRERLDACKQTLLDSATTVFPWLLRLEFFIEDSYPLHWRPKKGPMPALVLSSFPGPKYPISFCDRHNKVTDMHFTWNGINFISLIFTTLTYADGIRIVISADKRAFESRENLKCAMELIENEIKLLQLLPPA